MIGLLARVTLVALVGATLVAVGVAPQLSARVRGEDYYLRVAVVDPIDPFRGAYVALDCPDLHPVAAEGRRSESEVFVVLARGRDG